MFPAIELPWLLGAGVALVVGVIAFVIAAGVVDGQAHRRERPGGSIRRSA